MMPSLRRELSPLLLLLLLPILTLAPFFSTDALAAEASEYEVKAAFLYNFTKFVEWPVKADRPDDTFDLCILGDDPFGGTIDSIEEKRSGARGFKLHREQRYGDGKALSTCDILFISPSEQKSLSSILDKAVAAGILTVSDMDGFTKSGGIIGFKLKNARVAMSINPAAAERAGLKISSKLLKLADIEGE